MLQKWYQIDLYMWFSVIEICYKKDLFLWKKKLLNQNDFKILRNEHFELAILTGISIINQWILCLLWPSRALLKIFKLQSLLSEKFNFCSYFQFLAFKKKCVWDIKSSNGKSIFSWRSHSCVIIYLFEKYHW